MVRKKEFRLQRFISLEEINLISLEEINLSRQKQNYRFYLFDKSWNFSVKHVIYTISENLKVGKVNIFQHFSYYEQLRFHA